jgi:hypothetical protein
MNAFKLLGCCAVAAVLLTLSIGIVQAQDRSDPFGEAAVVAPPRKPTCRCIGESGETVAKIRHVLNQPLKSTGLEFTEEPLENVVNFLQHEYAVPIHVDIAALEDIGLTSDEPLSVNLQNISLRSALQLMLKQKQLTFIITNEVLTITTPEEAEDEPMTCVYDVQDLKFAAPQGEPRTGGASAWADYDALIGAITECVRPASWKENGGEGNLRRIQPGLLVIYQTRQVHEEVADLLAAIRSMSGRATAPEPKLLQETRQGRLPADGPDNAPTPAGDSPFD